MHQRGRSGGGLLPGPAGGAVVSLVLDGGDCDGAPSTVVDCTTSPPACLREGALPWAWVEAALR